MTAKETISAKITRPNLSGVVQRERLFSLFDDNMDKPVLWVSSPAGSGKTTLVSSYLDARKTPCIWYQCDEGDADPATFFYYMGLAAKKAAPKHKKPLPLLTPEYLAGVHTFTRRYFENLFSRLFSRTARQTNQAVPALEKRDKAGAVIVLDNYQDVPAGTLFHDVIASAFDIIPEGVHIVVLSRGGPPSALARLQANNKINLLDYGDIRFSLDESRKLALERLPNLDKKYIRTIHEKAEGWAAGIILMLERARIKGTGTESGTNFDYERVFAYLAGEIFSKTEKGVQDFLLKTALLPALSVPLAEKLTGVGNAGRILSSLNRRQYFTERLSGAGQCYQYHPLFRDFLLNRVKTEFAPDELAVMQRDAALLLEQSGQREDAARLYSDAGDWRGLVRMVILDARELLMQGRSGTLEGWIAAIPRGAEEDNPWLPYWRGMCSFPLDMPRAREYLEKAFKSFKAAGDTSGLYLSWAGIVDTYTFEFDEWRRLDDCIAAFGDLRKAYPSFPSKEIELIASSRMLIALTFRKTDQPQRVQGWLDRVSALLQENPSPGIHMDTAYCMSLYYLWKGEYQKYAVLLERVEAEIHHRTPSPFIAIRIKMMKGIHRWVTARYDSALKTLSEGLDIADKSGVHVFDSLLWGFKAGAEMARGNMEFAQKSLRNQMASLLGAEKTVETFFYHRNSAWYAILAGNPSLAAEHMEMIAARVEKIGNPYYRAMWLIGMAQTEFLMDRGAEARDHIQRAHQISLTMKSHVTEWHTLLIDAYFLLMEGKEQEGLSTLRRGLSLGGRHGFVHIEFYQPSIMRFLCAKALEEGLEQEYVKGLIKKLGLAPPMSFSPSDSPLCLENWPYPVRVYTLGRFEIVRDDQPLHFSGKEQKKPLELLKALIAFGGRDVPEERLADALWPDAAGDQAHRSFEMALSRLRKLIGVEDSIKCLGRQLSINQLYCWVDSLVLELWFDKTEGSSTRQIAPRFEKAVGLYKGSFLPADANLHWTISRRETLRSRLLRAIAMAGRHYEQAGEWEIAAGYYVRGIETDNLAEEFHRRLMICQLQLGNHADAVMTYNRCRRLFLAELGIEPSPETTAVYSSIIRKQ
ncbi:MAG: AAA family ATPase [Deltaproteobacteria bacterium]|nr:AAA family ATPase [Deltaproteobacteria bacterium]